MKRILLDTNAYVAFKRGDSAIVRVVRQCEFIGVNATVMGELLAGFKAGNREEANRKEFDLFLNSPRVQMIAVDDETAEYYAKVFCDLKMKGRPIPTNDMWIAASAMQHGLWLVSDDGHFGLIDGLLLLS
jgi:tRNA(fMet)-specific endonuclease VapC